MDLLWDENVMWWRTLRQHAVRKYSQNLHEWWQAVTANVATSCHSPMAHVLPLRFTRIEKCWRRVLIWLYFLSSARALISQTTLLNHDDKQIHDLSCQPDMWIHLFHFHEGNGKADIWAPNGRGSFHSLLSAMTNKSEQRSLGPLKIPGSFFFQHIMSCGDWQLQWTEAFVCILVVQIVTPLQETLLMNGFRFCDELFLFIHRAEMVTTSQLYSNFKCYLVKINFGVGVKRSIETIFTCNAIPTNSNQYKGSVSAGNVNCTFPTSFPFRFMQR